MQPYEKYKNSGIDWLGQIPEHWEVKRLKYLFRDFSKKDMPHETLLSVTQNQGVVPRDWVENRMVMPSGNLESFKFIEKGDFCISLRSFEGGLEYCHHNGIVSPAYTVLKGVFEYCDGFYKYLFKSQAFIDEMQLSTVGIREGKNISYELLKYSFSPVPPLSEQEAIAAYLDDKCGKIDRAIGLKSEQIEQLKTLRQVRIQQAVTRGLDAEAPLKESGIDWIGQIPEHWQVKRLKYVLDEINIRTTTGSEELLSLSKYLGIIPKSSLEERAGGAESLIGYKKVYYNNIVINKMQAVNGLIGVAKIEGITSPDYSIYKCKIDNVDYVGKLLLLPFYLEQYKKAVTGVMEGFIRLYTDDLYRIEAILPPLSEQELIVSYLASETERIDRAIALQNEQIEYLKSYKQSLINEAVTGKFRV